MSQPDALSGRPSQGRLRLVGIVFVVLIVVLATYGLVSRAAQDSRLSALTDEGSGPTVAIVTPAKVDNQSGLDLPGRLEAFMRAPIYARVPGYLKTWKYDIGSAVKAGTVLAEIDTPDLDQQLAQARADLNVTEANAKLAQISATRWQSLAGTDAGRQAGCGPTYLYAECRSRPGQILPGQRRSAGRRAGLQAADRAFRWSG